MYMEISVTDSRDSCLISLVILILQQCNDSEIFYWHWLQLPCIIWLKLFKPKAFSLSWIVNWVALNHNPTPTVLHLFCSEFLTDILYPTTTHASLCPLWQQNNALHIVQGCLLGGTDCTP